MRTGRRSPGPAPLPDLILATGAAATVAAVGGQLLVRRHSAVQTARDRLGLPTPAEPAPPVPAGAELSLPELTPYVTGNDTFYRIDTALQVPVIDPADWSLSITGMVDNPFTLDYATLAAKPLVEHLVTLTCVSNEVGGDLAGNALWLGFPIRDLLAEARPQEGADMVLSTSDDGWTAGTPLDVLTDPDRQALLAIGMNGAPLPIVHGFPVRMVVPGLYGYVSATKWVTELKVTTFAADQGYWTPLGWSARGPIKIASRIDVPTRHARRRSHHHCRGGLGPAHRHLQGRGAGRRPPLAAGPASRDRGPRHLAAVGVRLGRHSRRPHHRRPGHRRHR